VRPPAGAALGALAIAAAAVVAGAAAGAQQPSPAPRSTARLGVSVEGRPIGLVRLGDPAAPHKVLVVCCIHGNEGAGQAIVDRLVARRQAPKGTELLLVRDLNPDGLRHHTRTNAHGVDLNRNSSQMWRRRPGAGEYGGPRPFSEPETRAIRSLILAERPAIAVWYHQPFGLVDFPETGSSTVSRRYAALAGLPARRLTAEPGSMSRWENARVRRGSSFVVELPGGPLSRAAAELHAAAVLAVARAG
jgi:murein peptide amidase A